VSAIGVTITNTKFEFSRSDCPCAISVLTDGQVILISPIGYAKKVLRLLTIVQNLIGQQCENCEDFFCSEEKLRIRLTTTTAITILYCCTTTTNQKVVFLRLFFKYIGKFLDP
jgi:hypothetical protein